MKEKMREVQMDNWFSLHVHVSVQAPDKVAAIARLEDFLAQAGLSATIFDIFAITEQEAGWDDAEHQHPALKGDKNASLEISH